MVFVVMTIGLIIQLFPVMRVIHFLCINCTMKIIFKNPKTMSNGRQQQKSERSAKAVRRIVSCPTTVKEARNYNNGQR